MYTYFQVICVGISQNIRISVMEAVCVMNIDFVIYCVPLVFLIPLMIYSAIAVFGHKAPLYFQITFCAAVCACLEFIYSSVLVLCATGNPLYENAEGVFGLGSLSCGGFGAFFFAANFGQFDSIIDGGKKEYRFIRIISLIAPIVLLSTTVLSMMASESKHFLMYFIAVFNLSCNLPCSYYNLKMILIKDDGTGFIKGAKMLNLASLLYIMFQHASTVFDIFGERISSYELYVFIGLALFIPVIIAIGAVFIFSARGKKKWMNL